MAFPHPKSRKEHYRNDDKPNTGGVFWNFFKRTINIPKYRNAEDDVNPAKNRTFGGLFHDSFVLHLSRCRVIYPGLALMRSFLALSAHFAVAERRAHARFLPRFTALGPLEAASLAFQHRTAWRTRHSAAASRNSSPRRQRCGR